MCNLRFSIRTSRHLLTGDIPSLLLQRFSVELKVSLSRPLPGEIRGHGILEEMFPMPWLRIEADRPLEGVEKFLGIIAGKFKAVSFF